MLIDSDEEDKPVVTNPVVTNLEKFLMSPRSVSGSVATCSTKHTRHVSMASMNSVMFKSLIDDQSDMIEPEILNWSKD